jgi:hypothetical protein
MSTDHVKIGVFDLELGYGVKASSLLLQRLQHI